MKSGSLLQWKSLVLLLISLIAGSSNAFVARTAFTGRRAALSLHPDQAPDLEAYAYDLMKAAAMETPDKAVANNTEFQGGGGPVNWCRRMLLKNVAPNEAVEADE